MSFYYPRQIRFHETDGAGVVYFANVLTLCHEAYEASLGAVGVELADFFSPGGIVVPIIHGTVDCFKPLRCGDRITIVLEPQPIPKANRPLSEFAIDYRLLAGRLVEADDSVELIAQAHTRHCCINAETRRRQALTGDLQAWLAQT